MASGRVTAKELNRWNSSGASTCTSFLRAAVYPALATSGKPDDDVVDADFEVVDDDKKKS
jgi:hypothetical protein